MPQAPPTQQQSAQTQTSAWQQSQPASHPEQQAAAAVDFGVGTTKATAAVVDDVDVQQASRARQQASPRSQQEVAMVDWPMPKADFDGAADNVDAKPAITRQSPRRVQRAFIIETFSIEIVEQMTRAVSVTTDGTGLGPGDGTTAPRRRESGVVTGTTLKPCGGERTSSTPRCYRSQIVHTQQRSRTGGLNSATGDPFPPPRQAMSLPGGSTTATRIAAADDTTGSAEPTLRTAPGMAGPLP